MTKRRLALTILLLFGPANQHAAADTIWWTNDDGDSGTQTDGDSLWGNPLNWKIAFDSGGHGTGVPDETLPTYITTSDHAHAGHALDDPRAIIDGAIQATTKPLYVGGWTVALDPEHGDPAAHEGILDLIDGDLLVADKPPGVPGNPRCYYMRVGYRGATGTVNQSGGTVSSCTYISVAFDLNALGVTGLGTYNLSGGTVDALGFDLGPHGTGVLNVSGGVIENTDPNQNGTSLVGRGYNSQGTGYTPGYGLLRQSGGTIDQHTIQLGRETGSAGALVIDDNQDLHAENVLDVGLFGTGTVVQRGGTVSVDNVVRLAPRSGSYGSYTISGGTLQTASAAIVNGIRNGQYSDGDADPFDELGAGHLVVVGSGGTVDLAGSYHQNHVSRLTFVLTTSSASPPAHISPVQAARDARFEQGAVIDIDLQGGDGAGLGNGGPVFTPQDEQVFVLVTAGDNVVDDGVKLDPEDEGVWKLLVGSQDVRVAYCPNPPYTSGDCAP